MRAAPHNYVGPLACSAPATHRSLQRRRPAPALPCAATQYYLFQKFIRPQLDTDKKDLADMDEHVWKVKSEERRRLGIGPPLKPGKENAWRLEQVGCGGKGRVQC
jgi:hypothetical protein